MLSNKDILTVLRNQQVILKTLVVAVDVIRKSDEFRVALTNELITNDGILEDWEVTPIEHGYKATPGSARKSEQD